MTHNRICILQYVLRHSFSSGQLQHLRTRTLVTTFQPWEAVEIWTMRPVNLMDWANLWTWGTLPLELSRRQRLNFNICDHFLTSTTIKKQQVIISALSSPEVLTDAGLANYAKAIGLLSTLPFSSVSHFRWHHSAVFLSWHSTYDYNNCYHSSARKNAWDSIALLRNRPI